MHCRWWSPGVPHRVTRPERADWMHCCQHVPAQRTDDCDVCVGVPSVYVWAHVHRQQEVCHVCKMSHVFCQCLNDLLWPWNTIFSFGNILSIYRKQKSANSGEQSKQILSNILSGKFKWNYVYIYIKYVFKLHLNERRDEQLAKVIRGGIWHLVFLTFNSNLTSN